MHEHGESPGICRDGRVKIGFRECRLSEFIVTLHYSILGDIVGTKILNRALFREWATRFISGVHGQQQSSAELAESVDMVRRGLS